jgi:lactate permease
MDIFVGSTLPLIIIFILTQVLAPKSSRKFSDFTNMIPWSILIGLSYSLCAVFATRFLGNEFVSIISPLFAMIVATISAKFNFLIPKDNWIKSKTDIKIETKSDMNLIVAWSAYIIVIFLLLITRLVPSVKDFTKNNFLTDLFSLNNIFGTDISSSWEILYSPGFILVACAFCASLIQSKNIRYFNSAAKDASKSLVNAFVSLCGTLSMVYLFRNSGISTDVSMPVYIAQSLNIFQSVWYGFAPFLGILGSFITGSGTVSTLTFSPIQAEIAQNANLNTNIVLAQQVMGGAIGNMICVHNVVAAATVVNLEGSEGKIIKLTVIPALLLGSLAVISALLFSLL